jgi:hypothetical protein
MDKNNKISDVKLLSTFTEILGKKRNEMPDLIRRKRWEKWKEIVRQHKGNEGTLEFWANTHACEGCNHIDEDWCMLTQLPCTVNPIVTFQHGMIGMACQGVGYNTKSKQLTIW